MLGQRRRRWDNIETALDEYPVFAGAAQGAVTFSARGRALPANKKR